MTLKPKESDLCLKAHRHLLVKAKALGQTLPRGQSLHVVIKQEGALALPKRGARGSLVNVLARAIVGQQVAAKVAKTFWLRILDKAQDKQLHVIDFLAHPFEADLRSCGLSQNKTRFLIGLGEAHRRGHLSARKIMKMPHEERIDYLTQFHGIGVWTADMVGIFYCADSDIWPQGDLAVRRSFARLLQIDESATADTASVFAPFRSHLALHMWRAKDNILVQNP